MITLLKTRVSLVSLFFLLFSVPSVWATATFDFSTNILNLPVVSVPGSGDYQASLLFNGQNFTLSKAVLSSSSDIDNETMPASFFSDTGVLTIPLVDIKFVDGSVMPYSAELLLVAGSSPLVFNLTAAAPKVNDGGNDVDVVLQKFNIDTSAKSRIDNNGDDLPSDYSPLGSSFEMNRTDELFIIATSVNTPTSINSKTAFVELSNAGTQSVFSTEVLAVPDAEVTPWADNSQPSRSIAHTFRAATSADLNGDGLEETVVVYWVFEDGANRIKITQFADKDGNLLATDAGTLLIVNEQTDISAVGGDFDGDGRDEIAIALATPTGVAVHIATYNNGVFSLLESASKTLPASLTEATLYTALEKGNIDYDNPEELALVVTELVDSDNGISRYYLFDDQNAGYTEIASGVVQGTDEIGITKTAVVADVSLGDIDGDGLDEIVFGGLTNINSGGGCETFGHLLIALDDKVHQFAPLGDKVFSHFFKDCPSFSAWRLRYLHINTVDLDGDNIAEIQANQFIYSNFKAAEPWTEIYTLPESLFFKVNSFGYFDKSTSVMEASDVTGDGRQNIVFYNPTFAEIVIWGVDQVNGWSSIATIPTSFGSSQNPSNPIIVPVNLDRDGPVLKYSAAEYRFVFTEPVIIAALAAAPCELNVGQQIDDCRTRYGTATTVSVDAEASLTLSAGVHVGAKGGVKVFGIGAEIEAIETTTVAVTGSVLAAYSLEQSVIFTTGPIEDSVIFTTIPLDQYTYTIASHPIPELVGEQVVISLPRKPITIMANLDFYNQSIEEGGFRIGSNIFQHTPGSVDSYPTVSDKNRLVNQYFDTLFDVLESPSNALLDALDILELESDLQNVDQGTGSREVTLQVNEAFGVGVGIEVSRELRVSGEALGAVTGFSVGASAGANISLTRGNSTIYSGSVGAIDAGNFATNGYSYGLFAYTYSDASSSQEFEVINYWVETN